MNITSSTYPDKSNSGIRFARGEELQFFATLRKRVDEYFKKNNLSRKANATMVVKTIVLMCAYILPFIAIVVFGPPFWVCLLLWAVMGTGLAGIGMSVMHDANHGAYTHSEVSNRWIGYSLNLLGGATENWKYQHNVLHHTYTNVAGMDEDIDPKVILRFSPHAKHHEPHRYQWYTAFFFYSILTLYWVVAKDLVQYKRYKRIGLNKNQAKANREWFIRVTIFKLVYLAVMFLLPTLVAGLPFYQALIGWIVMHLVAGTILSVVFQLAHVVEETHFPLPNAEGNMENTWAVHQLRTTLNFSRDNKFLSWYLGGLNYQIEHHLFTGICHVHYPAISHIVKDTATEFGIEYLEKKTFWQALVSHVRLLKKLGSPSVDEIMG